MSTVQPTLEWFPNSGVYVLGAYAALQLGPGAFNLAGAKTGSVILGQQLKGVLPAGGVARGGGVWRARGHDGYPQGSQVVGCHLSVVLVWHTGQPENVGIRSVIMGQQLKGVLPGL